MAQDLTKELAEHCFQYITPVCYMKPVARIDVLTHIAKLIRTELNIIESSDPDRNR